MNELLFTLTAICTAREVKLSRVAYYPFSVYVGIGMADNTFILPAVAGVFYFAEKLNVIGRSDFDGGATRASIAMTPNSGQGLAGDIELFLPEVAGSSVPLFEGVAIDSLQYHQNTSTSGLAVFTGELWKVTTV